MSEQGTKTATRYTTHGAEYEEEIKGESLGKGGDGWESEAGRDRGFSRLAEEGEGERLQI